MVAETKDKKERTGGTYVTSVSVTKQFERFIKEFDLSPTECFRRGVAVTLFDLGIGTYQTEKNENRWAYVKDFMKRIEEDENLNRDFEKIKDFEKIRNSLQEIKESVDKLLEAKE